MLKDISVFLEKVGSSKLKTVVIAGYEIKSLMEAEIGTSDFTFVLDDGEERYMGTVNVKGGLKELNSYLINGNPIQIDTKNTSKHTGIEGDEYVLYHGEFVNLDQGK